LITPRHTLRLGACTIRLYGPEAPGEAGPRGLPTCVTSFAGGAEVPAQPNFDQAYMAQAQALGYGRDVWALCREHEILHTWLAVVQGGSMSPTLWYVAMGRKAPRGLMADEEAQVLAFQKYLHGGQDAGDLDFAHLHLPTLAQAARVLLAPLGE
jgi:hypothetical protein